MFSCCYCRHLARRIAILLISYFDESFRNCLYTSTINGGPPRHPLKSGVCSVYNYVNMQLGDVAFLQFQPGYSYVKFFNQ